jgi:hypothetical protein
LSARSVADSARRLQRALDDAALPSLADAAFDEHIVAVD